jgi:hypothetical protein
MGWVDDILAGGSLPLLYCMYTAQLPWGQVAWLAVLGTGAGFLPRCLPTMPVRKMSCLDPLLEVAESCLKILISLSTLLAKAHRLDPDIGALLCLAPALTLLSMQGACPAPFGARGQWVTLVTCACFLLVCLLRWEWGGAAGEGQQGPQDSWSLVRTSVGVVVAAACSCTTEGGVGVQAKLALRNLFYVVLVGGKVFLVLGNTRDTLSWILYGMLLLQSCIRHAKVTRRQLGLLGARDPTRGLITLSAVLVTMAYAWHKHVYRWAPWVGGALLVLGWARTATRGE